MKKIQNSEYYVNEDGEVFNDKGFKYKAYVNPCHGYCQVPIKTLDGKVTTRRLHRVVAEAFIPNPENKPEVNHIDGNKENNKVSNLEWVTSSENHLHATRVLLKNSSEAHYKATVSNATVIQICEDLVKGLRDIDIIRKYNISSDIVGKIRGRKSWMNISKDYIFPAKSRALSEETVHWICGKLQEGLKVKEILALATTKLDPQQISQIKGRRNYTFISNKYIF